MIYYQYCKKYNFILSRNAAAKLFRSHQHSLDHFQLQIKFVGKENVRKSQVCMEINNTLIKNRFPEKN